MLGIYLRTTVLREVAGAGGARQAAGCFRRAGAGGAAGGAGGEGLVTLVFGCKRCVTFSHCQVCTEIIPKVAILGPGADHSGRAHRTGWRSRA